VLHWNGNNTGYHYPINTSAILGVSWYSNENTCRHRRRKGNKYLGIKTTYEAAKGNVGTGSSKKPNV
jgi:hypothetical protein